MSRRPRIAKSPVRATLLLAACTLLPIAAWAARPVPVFQVDVAGQTAPDLQQAMGAALVRATGRLASATDPALAGLIANAPQYVERYDHGPQGELQVVFNGAAVDKAIAAADRSVWDPIRPFTLVVLYPPPDQTDAAEYEAGLEQAAEQRGLPISIVPLPVADASGNLLPREALLEIAHRYGAEQLLVGQPPAAETAAAGTAAPGGTPPASIPAAPAAGTAPAPATAAAPAATAPPAGAAAAPTPAAPGAAPAATPGASPPAAAAGEWQWILYTDFTSQTWSGPLTAGIEDTVGLLAPPAGPASANAPARTELEIQGVSSLADYANIETMLGAVPGVSAANVREVSGGSAVFDLTVRGGAAAIARALAGSANFTRVRRAAAAHGPAASGAAVVFRYRSG
jgi:hypothetical protein